MPTATGATAGQDPASQDIVDTALAAGTFETLAAALTEADLVGFTLPYELTYTNILNMIDLAHIPLMAEERTGEHPLVCGGGPGAHNPEPLADFFDFFLLGDGEEAAQHSQRAILG